MNEIHNNKEINKLIETEWFNQFDVFQQEQIRIGLKKGLFIFLYAKDYFYELQMKHLS